MFDNDQRIAVARDVFSFALSAQSQDNPAEPVKNGDAPRLLRDRRRKPSCADLKGAPV